MSRPMYGGGGATVVASAIRVLGNRLVLVGVSSDDVAHPVGNWSSTTLFGHKLDFFPVISTRELDTRYVKNLSFALRLIRFWKAITARTPGTVITQNYLVMWWLSLASAFDFKIFYFPGLGNQIVIGRKPLLGKLLAKVYETIQLSRRRRMDLVLAAASKDEIEGFSAKWSARLRGVQIHQRQRTGRQSHLFRKCAAGAGKGSCKLRRHLCHWLSFRGFLLCNGRTTGMWKAAGINQRQRGK